MKKLLAAIALSVFALTASAAQDTMWPDNPGRGTMDTTLVAKTETHPLEAHLKDMGVNFALTLIDGAPNRLIVMSGSPEEYSNTDFLCRMAKEYGGVSQVFVYKTIDGKMARATKSCS